MKRKGFILLCVLCVSMLSWAADGPIRRSCGTKQNPQKHLFKNASDCGPTLSVISADYSPNEVLTIPVVVHVITKTDGTGMVSEEMVHSQIDVLNQDFGAFAGTPGEPGTDSAIRFILADKDPDGNPHSGITYTENDTWFEDATEDARGEFGEALNWDPQRYLNIFTNSGGGALGYVVNMPWQPSPEAKYEGVVCAFDAFGIRPDQSMANLGRTATHEVGHYLGLEHTFGYSDESCPTGDCYTTGDLICDTNPHTQPDYDCDETIAECSLPNPIRNYMNYTDDNCMNQFTPEQINRMRCSILNYRMALVDENAPTIPNVESRWVTHVTAAQGGFSTTVFFQNKNDQASKVTLKGYDSNGELLSEKEVEIAAESLVYHNSELLFSGEPVSHFAVTGDSSVLVSASYRGNGSSSASAHIHESNLKGSSFMLYLGERNLVFDGIALVNLGSDLANITAVLLDKNGTEIFSKTLSEELPIRGKFQTIFNDFPDQEGSRIVISSSQPMGIIALRGTWPGASPAYLYTNPLNKIQ